MAQGKDIKYMTYGKHRSREYEHRTKSWTAKSLGEKTKGIADRCSWLDEQMRANPAFSTEIKECRFCGTEPALRSWPAGFRCACGKAYVVDRWFPDNVERVYCMISKEMTAEDLEFLREIEIRP
jgi:hypothetical protein